MGTSMVADNPERLSGWVCTGEGVGGEIARYGSKRQARKDKVRELTRREVADYLHNTPDPSGIHYPWWSVQ